ncbi:hypothetical protein GQX73_g9799 [Xylaria multiplex]|uniref:Uncharacterized protein n=1 Tax=Xylaria multiplex TaxID=323545 RepID=A0A7C8N0U6_9PEZI|nr:hypothetical protein GQX73_g9799 [Xylaria multiplex]
MVAIKILIGATIFTKWAETGSQITAISKLADLTGRLLRQTASEHLVTEIDKDTFNSVYMSQPLFLKEARYENHTTLVGSNFQAVSSNRIANMQFTDTMNCESGEIFTSWVETYDTSQIIQAARPDRPFVVNIYGGSGGQGHDIEKFLQKRPGVPKDKLTLQDN